MIVRMKKVTLVCLADDRGRTLEALRDLGVLHLAHIKEPESADLNRTRDELHRAQSALNILGLYLSEKDSAAKNQSGQYAQEIVNTVHEIISRKKELAEKLESLHSEKAATEPFGNFDPALIKQLAEKGITVKLYHVSSKKRVVPPEGAELFVIRQDATGQYYAIIGKGEFDFEGNEFPIPKRSLAEVLSDLKTVNTNLRDIENQLHTLTGLHKTVEDLISELVGKLQYIEAREGMGAANKLAYLQGFCPFNLVDKLSKAAAEQGWGLVTEEPSPTDRVPTLIRNPAWIRPIESLFKLIKILPGYNEVDVSVPFLFFLSLFFAMIVGDAGYGLIFLGATVFARLKMKKSPAGPFVLMGIFSVCTIIWGVLCGSYFGIAHLPTVLSALRLEWLADTQKIINLCLLIGAVHLTIAHSWNIIRMINSTQAIAQAGWVWITWYIFFAAKALLMGASLPSWQALMPGLAAVVLFMTPPRKIKTEWVNHFLLPLTIMSGFGDVLSYLRLFALGIASLQLAEAFNTMAGAIGFGDVVRCLAAAAILLGGHTLNIMLSLISVLVHGLRLNALEFSMHLGLEWSGVEYTPFTVRSSES